jgi:tetratricopeptide (TPR) repeat protein
MNKNILAAVIVLGILVVFGYHYYKYSAMETTPGENQYRLGNKHLEDGKYEKALQIFDELLAEQTEYKEAHLARALTLLQMERFDEARESFDRAIELDNRFANAYANRGILNDRIGRHEAARCAITAKRSDSTLNWPRVLDGFGGFSEIFLIALQRLPIELIIWKNS